MCLVEFFCYHVATVEAAHHRSSKNISGSLTPGTLTGGATVTLTGSASATTTASTNGDYVFSNLTAGTYTITPAKNGVVFQPATQNVSISGSSMVVNFSAAPMLQSISISAPASSIATGGSDQFSAIGTYTNGSTQNLTSSVAWSSSNLASASISSTGLAAGVAPGGSNISAALNGVASNVFALTVTGTSATLQAITITTPNSSLATGSSETLTATGTFSNGTTQNLTNSASWASSNPSAVSIASGALARAAGVGQSVISATQSGVTGSVTISATATISGIVSPASSGAGTAVTLGGAATATITADANGNYSFTILSDGVYTVTPGKSLYSFSPANLSVTVNNANVSGANFTVAPGTLSVSPSTFAFGNVNVGSSSQIQATLTANGGDVTLTNDTISGSGFGINGITFPMTITSGKSANLSVTFAPTSTGSATATLSLSNGTNTLNTANLSGSGAGLNVTPANLNFGQVLDGSAGSPQTLTLNAVGSNVTVTSDAIAQSGGGGNAFSITGLPAVPFTIAAGQSVQASVTFAPAPGAPGAAAGSISFASSANTVAPSFSGAGESNVQLSWIASTTPNVTYNVYRCSTSATACVQSQPDNFAIIANSIGTLAYTDSGLTSGQTYYYALTAVDSGNVESVLSTVSNGAVIP